MKKLFDFILYWLLLFAAMWCLTSCGSAWKVKRAKRLLESSGIAWKTDTVYSEIKVTVPETKFDTVLRQVNFIDTLVVTRDKVVTRVKINTVTKQVYVSTKCPEKTVIKKVPVTVNKEINVGDSKLRNTWQALIWLCIGFVLGWVGRSIRR